MSLRWYRRPHLVVLNANSSVLDAARAIEKNRIGAVVVQDKGCVAGIVTDRDLAVRALGRARDAATTRVAEVMTPNPATLTPQAGVADAVALMQERNVRRIPLVEGQRIVGMVTLDDLLLDEAAPLDALAAIVQSQISEGGSAAAPRTAARRRSLARAEATLGRLLAVIRAEADLNESEARTALETVLESLVRRLVPREANDLIAQLPSLLQPQLRKLATGPDKAVSEASIVDDLGKRLDVDPEAAAQILVAVAGIVAGSISRGQAEDVRGQLPAGLRELFRYGDEIPLFI